LELKGGDNKNITTTRRGDGSLRKKKRQRGGKISNVGGALKKPTCGSQPLAKSSVNALSSDENHQSREMLKKRNLPMIGP